MSNVTVVSNDFEQWRVAYPELYSLGVSTLETVYDVVDTTQRESLLSRAFKLVNSFPENAILSRVNQESIRTELESIQKDALTEQYYHEAYVNRGVIEKLSLMTRSTDRDDFADMGAKATFVGLFGLEGLVGIIHSITGSDFFKWACPASAFLVILYMVSIMSLQSVRYRKAEKLAIAEANPTKTGSHIAGPKTEERQLTNQTLQKACK